MPSFKLFGREIDTAKIKKDMQATFDEVSQKASETLGAVSKTVTDTSKKIAESSSEAWKATSEAVSDVSEKVATSASKAWEATSETVSDVSEKVATSASKAWEATSETVSDVSGKVATTASKAWDATSEAVGEAAAKAADTAHDAIEWLKDEENQEAIKNKAIDTWITIDEATDKVDNVLDNPLAQKIIPAPIMGAINIVRSPLTITKHILNKYVVTDEVREARMDAKMSEDGSEVNPAETDD